LNRKVTLELGYIGRRITHEYQPININNVPYMMTYGGQTFANAYANVLTEMCGGIANMGGGGCNGNGAGGPNLGAVTAQPFFENALAGTGYCAPGTCTAAVAANETGRFVNALVWSLWSDLDAGVGCPGGPGSCAKVNGSTGGAFAFPASMLNTSIASTCTAPNFYGCAGQMSSGIAVNASVGHGNYNAGFASLKMADWRGLTAQSNFTWSKANGTGAVVQASSEYTPDDPYDLNEMYGKQPYDRKYVYNMFFVYQPPFYKGQSGMMGRLLGGWTFASVFTAGTGTPVEVYTDTGDGQEFGAGDDVNYFGNENALPLGSYKGGHAYYNRPSASYPVNYFSEGVSEVSNWRNPILGMDFRDGGAGYLYGLPYWNMDFTVKKNFRIAENVSFELQGVFTNVLDHNQWLDPSGLGLYNPGNFGALGGEAQSPVGGNRQIELGARVRF
jgi:hypothetical protein